MRPSNVDMSISLTADIAGDTDMLNCGFFIPHLKLSSEYRHIFSTLLSCRSLVGALYLFSTYALPLTALSTAFGSDCLVLSHLGFPVNTPIIVSIITYADGISLNTCALDSICFATYLCWSTVRVIAPWVSAL